MFGIRIYYVKIPCHSASKPMSKLAPHHPHNLQKNMYVKGLNNPHILEHNITQQGCPHLADERGPCLAAGKKGPFTEASCRNKHETVTAHPESNTDHGNRGESSWEAVG